MIISLRNLPPQIEQAIVAKSQREGISPSKAATQLLQQVVNPPARNTDFDEFAGCWSAEEAQAFHQSLAEMRQVTD